MPDIPNNYNPRGLGLRRIAPPPTAEQLAAPVHARDTKMRPFGRKVEPLGADAALPTICPHECRMIDYGGCAGRCRLEAIHEL